MSIFKSIRRLERDFKIGRMDLRHHRVTVGEGEGHSINDIETCSFTIHGTDQLSGKGNRVRVIVEILERNENDPGFDLDDFMVIRDNTLFDYSHISHADLVRLAGYLRHEIEEALSEGVTTTSSLDLGDIRIDWNPDMTLKSAFFRIDSNYFKDREAVSLNADGFIGLCGWADSKNALPVYRAVTRWVDTVDLKVRKVIGDSSDIPSENPEELEE